MFGRSSLATEDYNGENEGIDSAQIAQNGARHFNAIEGTHQEIWTAEAKALIVLLFNVAAAQSTSEWQVTM